MLTDCALPLRQLVGDYLGSRSSTLRESRSLQDLLDSFGEELIDVG